jgi:hypothetical protein
MEKRRKKIRGGATATPKNARQEKGARRIFLSGLCCRDASYDYWKGQSTEAIIDSLKTGSKFGELTVKPNGVIMDGNTRIKVLEERGVNVNTLERIILEIPKEPIP